MAYKSIVEFIEQDVEDMIMHSYHNSFTRYHYIYVDIDNSGRETEVATFQAGEFCYVDDPDARYVVLNEVVLCASAENERYDMYIYMYDYPEDEIPEEYWKGVWYAG